MKALCLQLFDQCYEQGSHGNTISEEQLEAFLKSLKVNIGQQEKLKVAESTETVAAISREPGFAFSAEELKKANIEIPDGTLEGLAGGGLPVSTIP